MTFNDTLLVSHMKAKYLTPNDQICPGPMAVDGRCCFSEKVLSSLTTGNGDTLQKNLRISWTPPEQELFLELSWQYMPLGSASSADRARLVHGAPGAIPVHPGALFWASFFN